MNSKHELEWTYRIGFNMAACRYETMSQDFTHEHFKRLATGTKEPQQAYEIQRVEIELHDGYTHAIQSRTRNIVGFGRNHVTLSSASGKSPHDEVFHYDRWIFRLADVKEIRMWFATPPYVKLEKASHEN